MEHYSAAVNSFGPISIADAFWPSVFKSGHSTQKKYGTKHRWTCGEATVDLALYRLVDEERRGHDQKKAVEGVKAINGCRDRVISYPETEFLCVTFKPEGARKCGSHDNKKKQNLRAHHVRVGRYFNLLDFCHNGQAVEEGVCLVPEKADTIKQKATLDWGVSLAWRCRDRPADLVHAASLVA